MRGRREAVAAPLSDCDDVGEVLLCLLDVTRHCQRSERTNEVETILMVDEIACDCPPAEVDRPLSRISSAGRVDRPDHEQKPGGLSTPSRVLTNLGRGDRVKVGLELAGDDEQGSQALVELGVLWAESFSCSLQKLG
jgi:hypothetical protein